ncbi:MAG: tetratricopeptide repeat protein, partial [Gammaproteobacteria bacterium]|nr:tetratricopeptide repeat protein [Gammaproteobacteria bacterium]
MHIPRLRKRPINTLQVHGKFTEASLYPRLVKRIAIVALLGALSVSCASGPRGGDVDDASAQELYGQAKQALAAERYQDAITLYQKLESRFPYGHHAEQAQLEVAFAHHKNGESELA